MWIADDFAVGKASPVHQLSATNTNVTLAFQPVFDREQHGQIAFFEGLLRIVNTPDPLFHVQLLSIAESLGFIQDIDLHVLALTVDMLKRHPDMAASVNISQRTILEEGQQYVRRLAASQVSDRLIVEITESSEIPVSWVAAFAAGVREVGARLAVDDFETGYCDDVLVKAVRPDLLKVVLDDVSVKSQERLERTLQLAMEMGAEVVCEKIDNPEKIILMDQLHVRYIQGFALSEPIMKADLQRMRGPSLDVAVPGNEVRTPAIWLDVPGIRQSLDGHRQIRLVEKTGS